MKTIIAVVSGIAIQRMDDGRISFSTNSLLLLPDQESPKDSDKIEGFVSDSSLPNATAIQSIAIPPALLKKCPELKFGSAVSVYSRETKQFISGSVVGATGWSRKLGQISTPLAASLSIPESDSGIKLHMLEFTITPLT